MKPSFLLVLLVVTLIMLSAAAGAYAQQREGVVTLSYRTFSELASVYQQGDQASELVANVNRALQLIDAAHVKSLQGDAEGATILNAQANSILTDVSNHIPEVQQKALTFRTERVLLVVSMVPLSVVLSTLLFYLALAAWRRYERTQLFQMKIVRGLQDETTDQLT